MPLARGTKHESVVRRLRAASAAAIVRRARKVLGAVARPTHRTCRTGAGGDERRRR